MRFQDIYFHHDVPDGQSGNTVLCPQNKATTEAQLFFFFFLEGFIVYFHVLPLRNTFHFLSPLAQHQQRRKEDLNRVTV